MPRLVEQNLSLDRVNSIRRRRASLAEDGRQTALPALARQELRALSTLAPTPGRRRVCGRRSLRFGCGNRASGTCGRRPLPSWRTLGPGQRLGSGVLVHRGGSPGLRTRRGRPPRSCPLLRPQGRATGQPRFFGGHRWRRRDGQIRQDLPGTRSFRRLVLRGGRWRRLEQSLGLVEPGRATLLGRDDQGRLGGGTPTLANLDGKGLRLGAHRALARCRLEDDGVIDRSATTVDGEVVVPRSPRRGPARFRGPFGQRTAPAASLGAPDDAFDGKAANCAVEPPVPRSSCAHRHGHETTTRAWARGSRSA
jgi:hypothetical protein